MFAKILIANRGEIAVRIIQACRELGVATVAVYSDADVGALHVALADEAYHIGPPPALDSYLNIEALLSAARASGAEAVHPGYGFLSENASFARQVESAGLVWIGPAPHVIALMGDKVAAKELARSIDVPVVPGYYGDDQSSERMQHEAEVIGFPVMLKAAAGGGGRGMRAVHEPAALPEALQAARREARSAFGEDRVFLERLIRSPRHIEMQVVGDRVGNAIYLGERDCSIQRRHQKVLEEAPSPVMTQELRRSMGTDALRLVAASRYTNAGTIEFLFSNDRYYFLEMNTRIQVEHPITEAVSGIDLIREMILVAAGEPITVRDSLLDLNGHAIEVRVNAEDPLQGFRPAPRLITAYREPGGIGVRMDSGVYAGYTVPESYDSLMAKVIAWGADREASRARMARALAEYRIEGPMTTLPFARVLLEEPAFVGGEIYTTYVEEHLPQLEESMKSLLSPVAVSPAEGLSDASPLTRGEERSFEVEVNRKLFRVRVAELQPDRANRRDKRAPRRSTVHEAGLMSPMHGTIVKIIKQAGDHVEEGETLFIIEAMKMENEVAAQRAGRIVSIDVQPGETVEAEQRLAVIE